MRRTGRTGHGKGSMVAIPRRRSKRLQDCASPQGGAFSLFRSVNCEAFIELGPNLCWRKKCPPPDLPITDQSSCLPPPKRAESRTGFLVGEHDLKAALGTYEVSMLGVHVAGTGLML